MIGRTVTSIVKWISCKISLVISQRQAPFRQFIRTHAIFLLVIIYGKYVISYLILKILLVCVLNISKPSI